MHRTIGNILKLLVGSAFVVGAGLAALAAWQAPAGQGVAALNPLLRASAAPWVLLMVVLAAVEWRLLRALASARLPSVAHVPRAQSGSAVLEFALLFPFAVMVLLIIVQLALLMQGNLVINYAAYAAARSAVVQIPRDLTGAGEGQNTLVMNVNGTKMSLIRRAAVFALTPISGRVPPSPEGSAVEAGLRLMYGQYNPPQAPRQGLQQVFAEKFAYADQRTRVSEVAEFDGTTWNPMPAPFAQRRAVRVVIQHDLALAVPFARAIFANGSFQDLAGVTHFYTTVTAFFQLTNEGPRTVPWPEPLGGFCPPPPPPPPPIPPPTHPFHPPGF